MTKDARQLTRAAMIGALYVVLNHMQNLLLPGSATWAIQFRISEALCVLAFFTPAAVWGLAGGCMVFNLTYAGALPLDFFVGSLATLLATALMWQLRDVKYKDIPFLGLLMPAFWNAWLVGWELTVYIGGGFWINALFVAIGEAAVLLTLGTLLYKVMKKQRLDIRMFG
jgi:uncharacterized membrane protein